MMHRLFYFLLGIGVLLANKVRYGLAGYRTPRPFKVTEIARVIDYDQRVVEKWTHYLQDCMGDERVFAGKSILELGPGADLGIGLLLMVAGAARYAALDVTDLALQAPPDLYDQLIHGLPEARRSTARAALDDLRTGTGRQIQFVCDPDFSLRHWPDSEFDLVVSHASFQLFEDVDRVLTETADLLRPGGILCAHVDTSTQTGLLRKRDPLSIYRYPPALWNRLRFRGAPNRVRPSQYERCLGRAGFHGIQVLPHVTMDRETLARVRGGLARPFRTDESAMEVLEFNLLATRS